MVKQVLYSDILSEITLYPSWLSGAEDFFLDLKTQVDWKTRDIEIFGRTHKIPRLESFVGESDLSYIYSGKQYLAADWPANMRHVADRIRVEFSWPTNCALLNYYRDGKDSMGWHSDDEPELGLNPTIMILSLGYARDFQLRKKSDKSVKLNIRLDSGSLLVMKGAVQSEWQHGLPKRAKAGERISCTYRYIGK